MKHKICNECTKDLKGQAFYTMKSVEPKNFGKEFYVCKDCAVKFYGLSDEKSN